MITLIRQNYYYLLAIAIACIISISTLFSQSIRLDEAQSLWVSTKSIVEILRIDAQDVLVPLYEIILHLWIQIFGNSIVVARFLSFFFFLVTLPYLYLLGKEASNQRVAILAVTLFSLSPFIMWYSSEARMYTLFALITTLNHLFFIRFVRSSGATSKLGLLVTTVLGLYTHYFFIFLLLTQFVFFIIRYFTKHDYEIGTKNEILSTTKRKTILLLEYILIQLIAAICFTPWVIFFIQSGAAVNTQPLIPPPSSFNLFQALINFLFGFQSNLLQSFIISLWPIFVLSLFLIFTRNEKQDVEYSNYFALATFLPIILVFLGSFIRPIFLTRYLILATPTFFFLIAWMISGYQRRGTHIALSALLLVMLVLLIYQNISTTTPVKENYEGVSAYLQSHATPSDIITVSAPFTIYPIEYTYQGTTKIETIPLWDRLSIGGIPPYTQAKMIDQLHTYKSQYTHLFIVLSYDQGYEHDIKQYLDKHYLRIALKNFSLGLEVREYKLRYDVKK